jgi:hypothetical protein
MLCAAIKRTEQAFAYVRSNALAVLAALVRILARVNVAAVP